MRSGFLFRSAKGSYFVLIRLDAAPYRNLLDAAFGVRVKIPIRHFVIVKRCVDVAANNESAILRDHSSRFVLRLGYDVVIARKDISLRKTLPNTTKGCIH